MAVEIASLKALVQEVLDELPKPYSVHVIDEVFHAIETNPPWHARYAQLCDEGHQTTVNTWGARIVGELLGKRGQQTAKANKSTLIKTYSLLDTDARTLARKPKAEEAARMRWEYWKANKHRFPPDVQVEIAKQTALIDSLIMDGDSAAEAFRTVILTLRPEMQWDDD